MPYFKYIKVLKLVTNPDSEQQETIQPGTYPFVGGSVGQFAEAHSSESLFVFGSEDDPEDRHEVSGSTLSRWKAEGKVEFVD